MTQMNVLLEFDVVNYEAITGRINSVMHQIETRVAFVF
jgi:hypothetical protein